MRLLVLTGFFGSGKTTFLLRALRLAIRDAGLRTVLVQNEIGRVGVDPEVFRKENFVMNELLGGCICCNLATRFVSVLHTLASEKATDLVCIEASGIATPGMVRTLLGGTDYEALPMLQVNILDGARLMRIEKILSLPIVHQGIESSDICVVNKIDAAPEGFRNDFEARVRAIRPDARVHFTNLSASDTLPDSLAAPLLEFFRAAQPGPAPAHVEADGAAEHDHEHEHHGHPAVCAEEIEVTSAGPLSSAKIQTAFDDLVRGIAAGNGLIGHVKVALIGTDGARYFLNSTGIEAREGTPLPDTVTLSRVVINCIVLRIEQSTLESLTRKFLASL